MNKIDILFLAKGRAEFTTACYLALIANTNWDLVERVVCYGHGLRLTWPVPVVVIDEDFGGPVAIMNDYLARDGSAVFAKIDNDVIVPTVWLDAALGVMELRPELGLLGIEPPASRTAAPWRGGRRDPAPELEGAHIDYAPCTAIGGIGLMRRKVFMGRNPMKPHSIYGGFTDWQWRHPEVVKGWIVPPLNVFLLDRLPIEPWASLSKRYIAEGAQREWTNYSPAQVALWEWWLR